MQTVKQNLRGSHMHCMFTPLRWREEVCTNPRMLRHTQKKKRFVPDTTASKGRTKTSLFETIETSGHVPPHNGA